MIGQLRKLFPSLKFDFFLVLVPAKCFLLSPSVELRYSSSAGTPYSRLILVFFRQVSACPPAHCEQRKVISIHKFDNFFFVQIMHSNIRFPKPAISLEILREGTKLANHSFADTLYPSTQQGTIMRFSLTPDSHLRQLFFSSEKKAPINICPDRTVYISQRFRHTVTKPRHQRFLQACSHLRFRCDEICCRCEQGVRLNTTCCKNLRDVLDLLSRREVPGFLCVLRVVASLAQKGDMNQRPRVHHNQNQNAQHSGNQFPTFFPLRCSLFQLCSPCVVPVASLRLLLPLILETDGLPGQDDRFALTAACLMHLGPVRGGATLTRGLRSPLGLLSISFISIFLRVPVTRGSSLVARTRRSERPSARPRCCPAIESARNVIASQFLHPRGQHCSDTV